MLADTRGPALRLAGRESPNRDPEPPALLGDPLGAIDEHRGVSIPLGDVPLGERARLGRDR